MNNPMQYVFDANQHEPSTTPEAVPANTYDFNIVETGVEALKDDKGHTFVVKSQIEQGDFKGRVLTKRFNLWHNSSAENCRISHSELSALSHVTGRYRIDMADGGRALIGGRYKGRVTNDGQYNEIKEFFDVNGNRPAKAGTGYKPAQTAPVAVATPGAPAASVGTGFPVANAAPAAPAAPVAPPAAPAPVFPPEGWLAHPQAPGYYYKGQEVKAEAELRAMFTPPAAPAAPAVPFVPGQPPFTGGQPAPAAAAPAAAPSWGQASTAPAAAPSWGAPAAAPSWGAPAA